jgi:hypothetical protein
MGEAPAAMMVLRGREKLLLKILVAFPKILLTYGLGQKRMVG